MTYEAYLDYGLASEKGPVKTFTSKEAAMSWADEYAAMHIESGRENVSVGRFDADGEWNPCFEMNEGDL